MSANPFENDLFSLDDLVRSPAPEVGEPRQWMEEFRSRGDTAIKKAGYCLVLEERKPPPDSEEPRWRCFFTRLDDGSSFTAVVSGLWIRRWTELLEET